jgi:hypothetical protein
METIIPMQELQDMLSLGQFELLEEFEYPIKVVNSSNEIIGEYKSKEEFDGFLERIEMSSTDEDIYFKDEDNKNNIEF